MNCSQLENFLLEYNFMPQNPATLIWVQVTQIFKKEKKGSNCISENGQQKFLLHCAVFFCFVLFFTAVARGSSVRSLTSTSDRQIIKAHSLSLVVRHCHYHHQPSAS